jgi:hypothetical protein
MDSDGGSVFGDYDESDAYSPDVVRMLRVALQESKPKARPVPHSALSKQQRGEPIACANSCLTDSFTEAQG